MQDNGESYFHFGFLKLFINEIFILMLVLEKIKQNSSLSNVQHNTPELLCKCCPHHRYEDSTTGKQDINCKFYL